MPRKLHTTLRTVDNTNDRAILNVPNDAIDYEKRWHITH